MITKVNWLKYIQRLAAIDKRAGAQMQAWIDEHGLTDIQAAIDYAYGLATKYGETSATLSAEMYDYMADVMNADVPAAIPAETATMAEIAKALNWARYHSPSQIPSIVGRHVRQAGADTMMQNAKRDKAQWAWVPQGDTCAFCITLASRGWQEASKTVLRGNHAEHIHQNCDCTFAIAFKPTDRKKYDYIYDPDRYKQMYDESGGDINAMRRKIYDANKDEINAQRRDAYQAKQIEATEPKILKLAKQGNTFVVSSEDLFAYSQKIKPLEGFTDVVAHGDSVSIVFRDANGKETNVSAEEFANILEKVGVYKGGKIRLMACRTGAEDGVVPVYLAKRFNTEVLAPTETVNVFSDGSYILADDEMNAKMGIETGEWVLFDSNGRVK